MVCNYGCGKEAKYELKNKKWCCSKSINSCLGMRKKNSNATKLSNTFKVNAHNIKVKCKHCSKVFGKANIKIHETNCYLNKSNLKLCPICSTPIKNFRTSETCSYSCANKHFKTGENNGNWNKDAYRSTCFAYHKKSCVICGENKIVEVHHLDEDKLNNTPENLIPLCPTHHQYWHSRYKDEVYDTIMSYINKHVSMRKSG